MSRIVTNVEDIEKVIQFHLTTRLTAFDKSLAVLRPMVAADGYTASIQASSHHYCTPRTDEGPYTHVEIGFPDAPDGLLKPYAEDPSNPIDTVYGWVPIGIIAQVFASHDGIVADDLLQIAQEG